MKKFVLLSAITLFIATQANAKIWRVNNQAGTSADFISMSTAVGHASVVSGDTIYIEPSATSYGSFTITKQLVFIGNGYLLDSANNGNAGLQENANESVFSYAYLNAGSEGSAFIGLYISGYLYFNGISSTANVVIEKCKFNSQPFYQSGVATYDNIVIRKCFFTYIYNIDIFNTTNVTVNNLTIENCVFNGYPRIGINSASTNVVFRNNTADYFSGTSVYVANNIFLNNTSSTFNSCVVKNNLFVYNQAGVTVGPLNVNGNNLVSQTRANLIADVGSDDAKYMLAAGSPAIGGGVDLGGTKPDCGAFGGNDPYVLSGIPNIPTIYSMSFPNGNSIPAGAGSILVDFSTRNNN